ncbi:hypothetical protein HPP92_027582 [Vanilla planifolia]|uniref:4Fe-4S ferredoxin-type domain-containing protein n=1 Tax=Vanilla planifolia TaxID=51239 RepID=A0A835P8F0_VANPL|nr:hypothetical protein HPP92_027582 [Vanilla planifolia]
MMYNVLVSNEKSIESQYKSHVYADPNNVTPEHYQEQTREEFLDLFAKLDGGYPSWLSRRKKCPKAIKSRDRCIGRCKGCYQVCGSSRALLPQEEYPLVVAEELYQFLQSLQV